MVATTKPSTGSKSETVNYLLLYEAMVRHQDLEFDATHDHIKLTVDRIKYLGRPKSNRGGDDNIPEGMLSYLEMRRCLLRLGYTWNRSLPLAQCYDDDVSVASVNSSSTFLSSGQNTATASNVSASARDIIATDAQLIMLLTTLVEMEEQVRAGKVKSEEGEDGGNKDGLFLPEFIQAYKLIIGELCILLSWLYFCFKLFQYS